MTRRGAVRLTAMLTVLCMPGLAFARRAHQPGEGVPDTILYYETVSLRSAATVAAVQRGGGAPSSEPIQLSFHTLGREFDLTLEPTSPFAPGATVRWVDDTGVVIEPAGGGEYYRGHVVGDPRSWARITVRGEALAGMISTDGEVYFLEPASRFFGEEVRGETLAYRLSDTDSEWDLNSCAAQEPGPRERRRIEHQRRRGAARTRTLSQVLGSTAAVVASAQAKRAELGMVADFKYFNTHGAASANDIAEIVNSVDGIYQSELGVTVQVVTTVVFTTAGSDPFSTTTNPNSLLTDFNTWRNNNNKNPSQALWGTDFAHLMTGRNLDGSVIGIAFVGAVCSGQATGVDQDFTTAANMLTLLVAHEMGHNFGASHDAQAGSPCVNAPNTFIMNPVISSSLQQKFSDCSKSSINPFVAGASCLDTVNVTPPTPTPTPAPLTLNPIPSPITLGTTTSLTGTGFTAGSRIIGFVGTSSGTQSIGPFTPRTWSSTQLTWDVPANMSLGQGFAILAIVNIDQNYVGSEYQQAFLFGNATMNRPTILSINSTGLHAPDGALPVVYVSTPIYPGSIVTLTGTGFNTAGLNFFTSVGNLGPLWPLPGATSTRVQVQIPANAPIGLGAFEIVNSPYAGFVGSQTVFVPIGDPPDIASVSQSGSTITVAGTNFANGAVVNFFNRRPNGSVMNLGGPGLVATVLSPTQLRFQVPQNAVPGACFIQIVNPPFIPFTSSGSDPDGSFTLQ